jgi:DNA-binding CsgD family transcriptional regulator
MLRRRRTAVDAATPTRAARTASSRALRGVELALTPLCIAAAGAAFVAEVKLDGNATALSALGVVPVLAASMLRARRLTMVVVAFAVLLQVWGGIAGFVDRDQAGVQISAYLLTLAVIALQQSRSNAAGAADPATTVQKQEPAAVALPVTTAVASAVEETAVVPSVIRVTGLTVETPPVAYELSARVSQLLTRREQQVVVLAVQGFTARQIGAQLFIGERTVETHLANAYNKLNVRSKLELVRVIADADAREFRTRTEAAQQATA